MAAPPRRTHRSLPVQAYALWDTVPDVKSALDALDIGYFRNASLLCDALLRDDRINGVTSTRWGALRAAPLIVKPANETREAADIADLLGDSSTGPGLWRQMFPPEVIGELVRWGKMVGVAIAQIQWTGKPRAWIPRLVVWHPQFLWYDWSSAQYKLIVAYEQYQNLPRVDLDPSSNGEWFLWTPYGYHYGQIQGLIHALAELYIARRWNKRDWARFNEMYGMPITIAKVPAGASAESKQAYFDEVRGRGNEATVLAELDENGKDLWGVAFAEMKSRGFDSFQEFKKELDTDTAVLVLGQNLTTEVGSAGSKAAEQGHQLVKIDKALEDATLANPLQQQVLTHWARHNYGDAALAPQISFQVEPPQNEGDEAMALGALGDAANKLAMASERVDVDAILEAHAIPMKSREEVERERAERAARASASGPPDGGVPGAGDPTAGGGGADAADDEGDQPARLTGKSKRRRALLSAARAPDPDATEAATVTRRTFAGLSVVVENPAGSIRRWHDENNAETGQTTMLHDYGFIEGHIGADGEEIDVYLGPYDDAPEVYVVHQTKPPEYTAYDEDKIMLGFRSAEEATAAYVAHRNDGRKAMSAGMSTVPIGRFLAKLKRRQGTGRIRASGSTLRATMIDVLALADRARSMKTAALRGSAGRRAQLFGDLVADNAITAAAERLAPDLVKYRAQLRAATNWEDARRRILAVYRDTDPAALETIIRKARIMAYVGGQAAGAKRL